MEGYSPESSTRQSNAVNGHTLDVPSEPKKVNGYEKVDASLAMRRKLLVFSAQDKNSLQQQMRDICTQWSILRDKVLDGTLNQLTKYSETHN